MSGLIKRAPHPSDRRSIVLKLTRKGESRFVEAAHTHHARAVTATHDLTNAEMHTLLTLLARTGKSLSTLLQPPGEAVDDVV